MSGGHGLQDGSEGTESICWPLCGVDENRENHQARVVAVSLRNWSILTESKRRGGADAYRASTPPLVHFLPFWCDRYSLLMGRGAEIMNIRHNSKDRLHSLVGSFLRLALSTTPGAEVSGVGSA